MCDMSVEELNGRIKNLHPQYQTGARRWTDDDQLMGILLKELNNLEVTVLIGRTLMNTVRVRVAWRENSFVKTAPTIQEAVARAYYDMSQLIINSYLNLAK